MPSPVSLTSSNTPGSAAELCRRTSPSSVNLIALLPRLNRIWRTRAASPRSARGVSSSRCSRKARPLACASGCSSAATSSSNSCRSKGASSSSSLPASMRARSSASLTRRSRCSPARWIACDLRALARLQLAGLQQFRHAEHAGHRRADLVAERGQEARLRLRALFAEPALLSRSSRVAFAQARR
jgi:hypothetical protein